MRRLDVGNFIFGVVLVLTNLIGGVLCRTNNDSHFSKFSYQSNYSDSELFRSSFTDDHLKALKSETKHLFYYAFNNYMTNGFPYDEVKPLSCRPNKRNRWDPDDTVQNDVLGNFTVTLFDNLDTLIIMGDRANFNRQVRRIREMYRKGFAIDSTVQVFETNIRVLGSLLTAHLYAIDPRRGFKIDNYDGFLLKLAYDLGKRLILVYDRSIDQIILDLQSGNDVKNIHMLVPFPRTNLLKGPGAVGKNLQAEQCTSGVTSLIVEFSLLSRLTGDPVFEDITRHTFLRVWYSRSALNLLPMTIRPLPFGFTDRVTGIGASIDSFYEYALKYSILFNDEEFFQIWATSYKALLTHSQNSEGLFVNVDTVSGIETSEWIDALGGFFPGLQVLAGDIHNAIKLHRMYLKLWNYYGAIPERWNYNSQRSSPYFNYLQRPYSEGDLAEGFDNEQTDEILLRNSISLEWYPLRPEFIESTYYLYRATKDPLYLRVGESFLKRFRNEFMAPCGFSGISDVRADLREDRMESFVMGETLKYLYLLFDLDNPLNVDSSTNVIFSTEAHPFWYDQELIEANRPFIMNSGHVKHPSNPEEVVNQTISADGGLMSTLFGRPRVHHEYRGHLNREFERLKMNFYQFINNGWREVSVNKKIQDFFRINKLGNMTVGQNALVSPDLYEDIKDIEDEYESYRLIKYPDSLSDQYVSPDYLHLTQCETWQGSDKLFSDVFGNDQFYMLDQFYALTLRRPPYLPEETHPELELDNNFYRIFGEFGAEAGGRALQCRATHNTSIFGAVLDGVGNYHRTVLARVEGDKKGLYIEQLDGFRSTLEKIRYDDLDMFGKYGKDRDNERFNGSTTTEILRVLSINGYSVGEDERFG